MLCSFKFEYSFTRELKPWKLYTLLLSFHYQTVSNIFIRVDITSTNDYFYYFFFFFIIIIIIIIIIIF